MAVPSFLIRQGSVEFLNKQRNLFDLLESAEKEKKVVNTSRDEFMEIDPVKSNKRKRKETKQYIGKESLFKEPSDLPKRFKPSHRSKMPDYQRNPHKWVKYSLADITEDDMSNESNTAAALSFLNDMKRQKKTSSVKMEIEETEQKPFQSNHLHLFTRPIKQETQSSNEPVIDDNRYPNKAVFKSSKLIMPEYVVGQAKKEIKPKKKAPEKPTAKVFLSHVSIDMDE